MHRSILVVEDDSMSSMIYREWMLKWFKPSQDLSVQFASNGSEAERYLQRNLYSMTFLDLALPFKSGVELIRSHRDKMGYLIVASAYPECSTLVAERADAVLIKPIGREDFVAVVSSVMKGCVYVDKCPSGASKSTQTI